MIRALIFDFNGVLADDDPIHKDAFRRVAEEERLPFTDEEYLEKYLPLNDRDCFKLLFDEHSVPLPSAKLEELVRRKGVYYFQAIGDRSVLFADTPLAVKTAEQYHSLAIASGARKQEICHILKQGQLEECFKVIVAAEDVTFGKPHPEPFLRAHAKLRDRDSSLAVSECIAIEDSIGGIHSAQEAGMKCLGVAHSYSRDRLLRAKPDWIIDSISDFVAWLKKEVPR
jgi:beta-phosphoglucomutase-like phosphatase (HAD superfamily)